MNIVPSKKAIDNHFSLVFITRLENHLWTNKVLVNVLYNDVISLTSIINFYIGPKSVISNIDTKALSVCIFYNSNTCGQTRNLLAFSTMI